MFSYIKGILVAKSIGYVIIDVGGVGFKIFMSETSIKKLGETGEEIKVFTHMQVREDDISLYGFTTNEELRMFELLISVSGVGAKSAIAMLSNISPSSFALAVISNDIKSLTKIPGIGSKTAQRIVLELKDKLKTEESISNNSNEEIIVAIQDDNKTSEAVQALKVLGYTSVEIEKVLRTLDTNNMSVEDIIRKALINLGR